MSVYACTCACVCICVCAGGIERHKPIEAGTTVDARRVSILLCSRKDCQVRELAALELGSDWRHLVFSDLHY